MTNVLYNVFPPHLYQYWCLSFIFQRHYNQLREEFSKTKAPLGLEDIDGEEIDPKEKQYPTEAGASGSKESTPGPQIVPADNNANSMINPEDLPHIGAVDTWWSYWLWPSKKKSVYDWPSKPSWKNLSECGYLMIIEG